MKRPAQPIIQPGSRIKVFEIEFGLQHSIFQGTVDELDFDAETLLVTGTWLPRIVRGSWVGYTSGTMKASWQFVKLVE